MCLTSSRRFTPEPGWSSPHGDLPARLPPRSARGSTGPHRQDSAASSSATPAPHLLGFLGHLFIPVRKPNLISRRNPQLHGIPEAGQFRAVECLLLVKRANRLAHDFARRGVKTAPHFSMHPFFHLGCQRNIHHPGGNRTTRIVNFWRPRLRALLTRNTTIEEFIDRIQESQRRKTAIWQPAGRAFAVAFAPSKVILPTVKQQHSPLAFNLTMWAAVHKLTE